MTARSAYLMGMMESKVQFIKDDFRSGDYKWIEEDLDRVLQLIDKIWKSEESSYDREYQQLELAREYMSGEDYSFGEDRTV